MKGCLARDSVMERLKTTSKGKLCYDSNYHPESISLIDEHNSVIRLPWSSPPKTLLGGAKNNLKFHEQVINNQSDINSSIAKTSVLTDYTRNPVSKEMNRKTKEVGLTKDLGLHASSLDIVGLLVTHASKVEGGIKAEMKKKKNDFLAGVQRIKSQNYQSYLVDEAEGLMKYENEINMIDKLQRRNERFSLDSNQMKKVHDNRRSIVLKNNENIRNMTAKISTVKKEQEERRQKNLALSKMLQSSMVIAEDICKNIVNDKVVVDDSPQLHATIKTIKDEAIEKYMQVLHEVKVAINSQEGLEDACQHAQNIIETLNSMREKMNEIISVHDAKKQEDDRKAQEIKAAEEKQIEEERKLETSKKSSTICSIESKNQPALGKKVDQVDFSSGFVASEAFKFYEELLRYHQDFVKSYEELTNTNVGDTALQKERNSVRFKLTKVINTPINSISDQSPSHLIDKIKRLTKLLKGEIVKMGEKTVNVNEHPNGLAYCKDAVAKKLVRQGADQISSNFKSAFTYAAVALGIWAELPDVGKLILAQFYIACPYLVPYHIPKSAEQPIEDYYRLLGYKVDGKEIEPEEKYLKKLSGIVRLYAAIVQSSMPPYLSSTPHPHGIHNGWTWLSRLLNLEPIKNVTATVIFDFLEVAGYELSKKYGRQFQKLLQLLLLHVLPKIDAITPADEKASISRLKNFLEKCHKNGSIPPAAGCLSTKWWKQGL